MGESKTPDKINEFMNGLIKYIQDKEKDEELKMNINDIFKTVLEEETDEFRTN